MNLTSRSGKEELGSMRNSREDAPTPTSRKDCACLQQPQVEQKRKTLKKSRKTMVLPRKRVVSSGFFPLDLFSDEKNKQKN